MLFLFFLFFFKFFFRRNFCHGILDIVIMLIIKISRVLHLILGLSALSKSARLYRTTAQQQPQEHKRMWRHRTRVQYNNNESETDRRRESLYKEEPCYNNESETDRRRESMYKEESCYNNESKTDRRRESMYKEESCYNNESETDRRTVYV